MKQSLYAKIKVAGKTKYILYGKGNISVIRSDIVFIKDFSPDIKFNELLENSGKQTFEIVTHLGKKAKILY